MIFIINKIFIFYSSYKALDIYTNKIILDFIIKDQCTIGSFINNNKLIYKNNYQNQQQPKDLIIFEKVTLT